MQKNQLKKKIYLYHSAKWAWDHYHNNCFIFKNLYKKKNLQEKKEKFILIGLVIT